MTDDDRLRLLAVHDDHLLLMLAVVGRRRVPRLLVVDGLCVAGDVRATRARHRWILTPPSVCLSVCLHPRVLKVGLTVISKSPCSNISTTERSSSGSSMDTETTRTVRTHCWTRNRPKCAVTVWGSSLHHLQPVGRKAPTRCICRSLSRREDCQLVLLVIAAPSPAPFFNTSTLTYCVWLALSFYT